MEVPGVPANDVVEEVATGSIADTAELRDQADVAFLFV
jgi:hypothetical protein